MADQNTTRHGQLVAVLRRLPTDYADYGGEVVRWEGERDDWGDMDCSAGLPLGAQAEGRSGLRLGGVRQPGLAASWAADVRASGGARLL